MGNKQSSLHKQEEASPKFNELSPSYNETTNEYWIFSITHRQSLQESMQILIKDAQINVELMNIIISYAYSAYLCNNNNVRIRLAWSHANYTTYINKNINMFDEYYLWLKEILHNKQNENNQNIKIVIEGDKFVGKTSLLYRLVKNEMFSHETFDPEMLGICDDILISIENKYNITIDIVDSTADTEGYLVKPSIYKQSDIFLIVFDINKQETFEMVKHIKNKIDNVKNAHFLNKYIIIIVGNKCDLRMESENNINHDIVDMDKVDQYLTKNTIPYIEISNKNGKNVQFLFQHCIYEYWLKCASI